MYYYKANEKVGELVEAKLKRRRRYPDGNWCLWHCDILLLGAAWQIDKVCAEMGIAKLTPMQNHLEFQGTLVTPMPVPTDPDFVVEAPEAEDAPELPETPEFDETEPDEPLEEADE